MNNIDDKKFMSIAIDLAKKGNYRTHPNPLVGAVIVKDGKILSKGYHRRFRGRHAEREAIDKSTVSLNGSTMYVTLEPCNHYGKTPPCTNNIIRSGISEIIYAIDDIDQNIINNKNYSIKNFIIYF